MVQCYRTSNSKMRPNLLFALVLAQNFNSFLLILRLVIDATELKTLQSLKN